jgi:chromosome partitioning protein
MGSIVALCGQKGGSGKTTTAEAVAGELIARGLSVLLVDADPQGTAQTWADVATENGRPCPTTVAMGASMHQESQLPRLRGSYDAVIIDCPPRHSEIQRSALMAADLAVLPCGPSAHDIWAMADTVDLVTEATKVRPKLQARVLITRKMANTVIGQGARSALAECPVAVMRAELHYRVAYQEAPASGQGAAQYAPSDPAAAEVIALVDEIMEVLNGKAETGNRTTKAQKRQAALRRGSTAG